MVDADQGAVWRPDVLGNDFQQRDLDLPGGHVATLVRYSGPLGQGAAGQTQAGEPSQATDQAGSSAKAAPSPKPAVLYLHGFVDYFFQAHEARAFAARGYPFYAIDLRGYGRSIGKPNDHPTPNYVPNTAIYAQDLDAALAAIEAEGHSGVVLVGHSTGGLIGPLWAKARPNHPIRALVLDSPWLDFNRNWLMRGPVTQLIRAIGPVAPRTTVGGLKSHYGMALHRDTGGEWDYSLAWKPHEGFPVAASWFTSIRRGQAQVKKGLNLPMPILVMTSLRVGDPRHATPEQLTTDTVLDPRQMWRLAPKLGLQVEVHALEGAAHDLALSPEPARTRYFTETIDWLDRVTGG